MKRAIIIVVAAAAASSCAGDSKIAVRALPTPLAAGERSVSFRVAEANGQFALGNVALALESYRKALREDATSVDAMVGMAASYDAMGRFDLSRRHYEAALAIEPTNRDLLGRLSASLLQQGRTAEAAAVRQEIAARSRVVTAPMPAATTPVAPQTAMASEIKISEPSIAPIGASVTLALPVARRVTPVTVSLVAAVEPRATPTLLASGPRLERLSLGEVALVTTGVAPGWILPRNIASRTAVSALAPPKPMLASLRPTSKPMLASLRPSPTPLLLLNAARSQGLAARTRRYLAGHGFGNALLGDAPRVRMTTVIIAPVADRPRAQRLARAFGIKARVIDGRRLMMILGRDTAARRILAG